ncbi:MAG: hypothetical protein Q8N26_23380 [Myxococcales bacterium]|nr:hypothetical protein [Myxococcales bacterium]
MLSKSAAKAFFLEGTALTSAVFLSLTWDTFQQIPARTNPAALTDSVKRGKHVWGDWEDNDCRRCHPLFGEGAYHAPELTKVSIFMRALLMDANLSYLLIKLTGVDRDIIEKWLYLIVGFTFLSGILGAGDRSSMDVTT